MLMKLQSIVHFHIVCVFAEGCRLESSCGLKEANDYMFDYPEKDMTPDLVKYVKRLLASKALGYRKKWEFEDNLPLKSFTLCQFIPYVARLSLLKMSWPFRGSVISLKVCFVE